MSKLIKKKQPLVKDELKEARVSQRIEKVKEYLRVSRDLKVLNDLKQKIAKELKEEAEEFNADELGNKYETNGLYTYGLNINKKVTLNTEKAKVFLESKGLLDKVLTPVIDEEKLSMLVQQGEVTLDDLNMLSDVAVSYKILVKEEKPESVEEEEMPTIDTSSKKKIIKKK